MPNVKEKPNRDPYQKYLEKKHSNFQTPEKLIGTVVEKATGSELIERRRIIEGEVNEVYDVTTKNKQKVIVRISRLENTSFETEERVIRLALMVGVPAPKVLLIDQVSSGPEKLTFCVEEKIEGESLKDLMKSIDKDIFNSIVSEAGEILSKINGITVNRFGNLDGEVTYKTWADYIFHLEEKRDDIVRAGKVIGVGPALIDRSFEIIRKNEDMFQISEAKLLHGDFSPKHLLIKNNHIVGIIDFESTKGGDPIRDFAWVNYFYGDSFPLDWLKKGYLNKSLFDENFDLKMKLYRLHLGLDLINYYESEKNESGMNHTRNRFLAELKDF